MMHAGPKEKECKEAADRCLALTTQSFRKESRVQKRGYLSQYSKGEWKDRGDELVPEGDSREEDARCLRMRAVWGEIWGESNRSPRQSQAADVERQSSAQMSEGPEKQ